MSKFENYIYEKWNLDKTKKPHMLFKLFWIFYIGALFGVIIETIWCIVTNGYFEYRTALILEPLNPVYGLGAIVLTLILCDKRNFSTITIYLSSFVIGGLFESMCSIAQETVFGTISWKYGPQNFGILGNRTSLLYCILWGFLGVAWVKFIYPLFNVLVQKIELKKFGKYATVFLSILLTVDIVFSSRALLRQKERRNDIPSQNSIDSFYDTYFTDDVLKKFYHNITVVD